MLQEHKLDRQSAHDAEQAARLLGLEARFTARDNDSASRGTAIIVNPALLGISREKISFRGGEDGTITTACIVTPERKFDLACVYLPSDPRERVVMIDNIARNKWITTTTILEGDHNMVADLGRETEGRGAYENTGAQVWFRHLANKGLIDAEREEAGPREPLFTRGDDKLGPNVRRTRLDKFMMPEAKSFHQGWQWTVKHSRGVTSFESDHAPLLAILLIPETRPQGPKKST